VYCLPFAALLYWLLPWLPSPMYRCSPVLHDPDRFA
jgi:hypothetical protein